MEPLFITEHRHAHGVQHCTISSDGQTVASTGDGSIARLIKVHGPGGENDEQTFQTGGVKSVSIGGDAIATVEHDEVVVRKLSDPSDVLCRRKSDYLADCKCGKAQKVIAKLSRDGKRLVCFLDGRLFVICVTSGKDLHTYTLNTSKTLFAFDMDSKGHKIFLQTFFKSAIREILMWRTESGVPYELCADHGAPGCMASDARGNKIVMADDRWLWILDVHTSLTQVLPEFTPAESPSCAITADGSRVVAITKQGFGIWDCENKVKLYSASAIPVSMCSISGTGSTIITGGKDTILRVWKFVPTVNDDSQRISKLCALARKAFEIHGNGEDGMCIGEAARHVNYMLTQSKLLEVNRGKVMQAFVVVADENAEMVSEATFVGMCRKICEESPLFERHVARFRSRAKEWDILPYKIAVAMMRNLKQEMEERCNIPPTRSNYDTVLKELLEIARVERGGNQNLQIDEKVFIAALKKMVYEPCGLWGNNSILGKRKRSPNDSLLCNLTKFTE